MKLVTGKHVRDAAHDTLKLWLPETLADSCEEHGLPRDALRVPREKNWHRLARTELFFEVDQRPAILITTTDKQFRRHGDGRFDIDWLLLITLMTGGQRYTDTVDDNDVYSAAVELAMATHADLGGLTSACEPLAAGYEPIEDGSGNRTVMRATSEFLVTVENAMSAHGGRTVPRPDPTAPAPPQPTVLNTDVIVVKEP